MTLTPGREVLDDSHFGVTILACSHCGQGFVSVFSEQVDWVDGEDPQYVTVVPLMVGEETSLPVADRNALLERLTALALGRRCLHRDYPKGAQPQTFWRAGLRVI